MSKWKEFLARHECVRRALRTFLQTAAGVLAAAVVNVSGVLGDMDLEAVVVLAVATGLAAVMNMTGDNTGNGGEDGHDGSGSTGV